MYKIVREDQKVQILDWNGKIIYSVPEDAIVVYVNAVGKTDTAKANKMSDEQLLLALSKAVKLDL